MRDTEKRTASLTTLYTIYYVFCLLSFEHMSATEDDTGRQIPVPFTPGA